MYKVYYEDFNTEFSYKNCMTFNNLKYLIEYIEDLDSIDNIIIYIEY